jgi:Zn-dependent peptidase ImmA (M78 family)
LNKALFNANKYEKYVFTTFNNILQKNGTLVNPKKSKIIFHPKYYSRDRKAYITFDIAIETRLNKKDKKPALLTIIECKHYSSRIPVDDVEEFVSKVHQVSRLNVKAIFVTNSTFQPSALAYGVANEIGLARLIPGKSIIWESKRTIPMEKNQVSRLVQEYVTDSLLDQVECSNNFIGSFNGTYTTDIYVYLYNFGVINSYYKTLNVSNLVINADYLYNERIEEIAEEIIKIFWNNFYSNDRKEMLINGIKNLYNINIIEDKHLGMLHDELVLGKINFISCELCISKIIKRDDPRWIFTLAHEFSHFILHRKKLQYINREIIENEMTLDNTAIPINNKSFFQFEWQANRLAACLLMPKREFLIVVDKILKDNFISKLPLYLDFQSINITLCKKIVFEISRYFDCSKRSVFIRLEEFGLIIDHSSKSLKDTLPNWFIRSNILNLSSIQGQTS